MAKIHKKQNREIGTDGRVFVWGGNEDGKLGLGQEVETAYDPTHLDLGSPVIYVACGYYHTALVTDDGKLYTMGEIDGGKLGLSDDILNTHIPQHVDSIAEPVKSVACGSTHTVALTESGDCYVFGDGESGQLGLGTDVLATTKPTRLDLPFKVAQVSCGQNFTALISEKGQLYTCGDGRHGKLAHGNDQFSNHFRPFHCKRFSKFIVNKAACGGCHMIVSAQPRVENGEVESDGEADEMKAANDNTSALEPEMSVDAEASPGLHRTLSAREKRRNEVQQAFSTLNQTLPVLKSNKGLPALSATMPALKSPPELKENGHALNRSMVPSIGRLPNGQTLSGDDVDEDEEESEEEEKGKKK
ncbi:X-linked retinitis pigmentosa GTPase regulator-like, partial [Plakobranchus ocellatus]